MAFDRIGPYALRRSDLAMASLVISFRLGSKATRARSTVYIIAAAIFGLWGILSGEYLPPILAAAWLTIVFASPALGSLKQRRQIILSFDPEGIAADSPDKRTLYKWRTIGNFGFFGSRLFIMVTPNCAIVLPERISNRENLERLVATIRENVGVLQG